MSVTIQQRTDIMGECVMIAKQFLEAANAVRNSQYAAFATHLDEIEGDLDVLKSRISKDDARNS